MKFEIHDKPAKDTTYLALRDTRWGISLCIVRKDGSLVPGAKILSIDSGIVTLHYDVSNQHGLQIAPNDCVKVQTGLDG